MTLRDDLKARIAAEPDPLPTQLAIQGRSVSAQTRRNRLRIGLPEYPTNEECVAWALSVAGRKS